MLNIRNSKAGFTLIEVMVAMAISGVVLASIAKVYSSQLKTHTTQQQVVEMQQSMRAVLYLMERDLRMAGYAPLGGLSDPVISITDNDEIHFVMDIIPCLVKLLVKILVPGNQILFFKAHLGQ